MTTDTSGSIHQIVSEVVHRTPVYDIHSHVYDPAFGELLLWGIDDLLTYHYLVAEAFRWLDIPEEKFWSATKAEQAEIIWDQLFIRHSPISESCRGVITTLNTLGFDVKRRDLAMIRKEYARWNAEDFITRAFEIAKVREICMTNSPFDDLERPVWEKGFRRDERFKSALRIDPLLLEWETTAPRLRQWGYEVQPDLSGKTFDEVRRFLGDWAKRIDSQYCMVSLPPEFTYPDTSTVSRLIEHAVMPFGREHNQAFALMIGVRRQVNPALRLAGDSIGSGNVNALEKLCAAFPEN